LNLEPADASFGGIVTTDAQTFAGIKSFQDSIVVPVLTLGVNKITYSPSMPSSGSWTKGDVAYNTNMVSGGNAMWVCITTGSPGVWKEAGLITL
jgi:hypothetical protein